MQKNPCNDPLRLTSFQTHLITLPGVSAAPQLPPHMCAYRPELCLLVLFSTPPSKKFFFKKAGRPGIKQSKAALPRNNPPIYGQAVARKTGRREEPIGAFRSLPEGPSPKLATLLVFAMSSLPLCDTYSSAPTCRRPPRPQLPVHVTPWPRTSKISSPNQR